MYNNQLKRTIEFNTEPILNDIDNIVKDGLTKLLDKYVDRYQLLERTHQAIMNLPSVVDELANRTVSYNFPPLIGGRQNEKNEMIEKDLQAMISANENLLARVDILSKENEELTNELRELKKQLFKDTIDLSVDEVHIKIETLVPVEPVSIDSVEKENIRLEIEENDVPDEEADLQEDSVEEDDDEEDVEEIPAGTKLGGKTWDGDDWETDDEYEDVVEEDDEVVEEEQTDEADEEQTDEADEEQTDEADEEQTDEADEQAVVQEEVVEEEQADEADVQEEEDDVETEKSDSEEEQEADEDEDIFEIDIDDVTYCTNNEENGFIYELKDGEMGDKIGYFKEGEPFFYADEN